MQRLYSAALVNNTTVRLCRETGVFESSWKRTGNTVQVWEPEVVRVVYDELRKRPAPVLMDVGAGTGSFSLLPVALPALKVLAVEANHQVLDVLVQNLTLNGILQAVAPVNIAVSDYRGMGTLQVPLLRSHAGMAALNPENRLRAGDANLVNVDVMRIDDLVGMYRLSLPRIHVIKLDIEGLEVRALKGARTLLETDRPVLVLECYRPNLLMYNLQEDDVYDTLHDLGYTWSRINAQNIIAVPA